MIAAECLADIEAGRPRSVVNATGVLLHTNLGRAPMNRTVSEVSAEIASTASNVEIDLRTGKRSSRSTYLRTLLPLVTGAEDGFAVNNNAGALLLALASVPGLRRVAVSRGEMIEIGGSFRLPDLMAASGATLVEVGTTNRTRLSDYEAVAGSVDAILKVHPSNYRVEGFQEEASYGDLGVLAHANSIPFIADVGSGLIDETAPWLGDGERTWLADEPSRASYKPSLQARISCSSPATSSSEVHRRGSSLVSRTLLKGQPGIPLHEPCGWTVRRSHRFAKPCRCTRINAFSKSPFGQWHPRL